ncbi:MAG: DUF5343 domain-containing protein [Verrucomicrobiae bacterium]|nr:DUF5343 domain-containing protein [Verrucomicrobiae bacterium]
MADEKKTSFPKMPTKNWWALRDKFKQTIPTTVTDNYVASVLNMTQDSARANVLTPLKLVGIVTAEGKPTELAKQWRDDQQYPKVCETIRNSVYPKELLEAFHSPTEVTEGIERWFMNHSGVGAPAAKMFASFYVLLCEADFSKAKEAAKANSKEGRKSDPVAKPQKVKAPAVKQKGVHDGSGGAHLHPSTSSSPSLHIDVQVHIASDASAEQIDRIFASMAKHLKGVQHTQESSE